MSPHTHRGIRTIVLFFPFFSVTQAMVPVAAGNTKTARSGEDFAFHSHYTGYLEKKRKRRQVKESNSELQLVFSSASGLNKDSITFKGILHCQRQPLSCVVMLSYAGPQIII